MSGLTKIVANVCGPKWVARPWLLSVIIVCICMRCACVWCYRVYRAISTSFRWVISPTTYFTLFKFLFEFLFWTIVTYVHWLFLSRIKI